ncbi:MAG: hypothetical protein HY868_08275 [Chloroflexi bacterium]|nr:hypothetical protein [Chloroflexota bacterium]
MYFFLERWLRQTSHLPARDYAQPILAVGLVWRIAENPLPLLLFGVLVITRFRALARPWRDLEHGAELRALIGLLAGIYAWTFAAYDYNFYFNQGHWLDRAWLIGFAVLILWRPIFLLPFLALAFTLIWQFDYPLTWQFSWTEIDLPLRALVLFTAAFLLNAATRERRADTFLFLLLCLVASAYWSAGVGKLELDWLAHPYLYFLLPAGYAHGWLSFLDANLIVTLTQWLAPFTLPLMLFTLVVELGALVALWRRDVTIWWLAGCVAMHAGILLVCGIAFWKWILLDAALILIWRKNRGADGLPIFTRAHFFISIVLIAGSSIWFKPVPLAWYDTPITRTIRLEAIGASGAAYVLPSHLFSHYADLVTFSNFGWLDPARHIPNQIWGVTMNNAMARALVAVKSFEQFEAVEVERGSGEFDAPRAELFDDLVRRFLANRNASARGVSFQAPGHLWVLPRPPVYADQEPIHRVRVYQVTWLYHDGALDSRRQLIREISIAE